MRKFRMPTMQAKNLLDLDFTLLMCCARSCRSKHWLRFTVSMGRDRRVNTPHVLPLHTGWLLLQPCSIDEGVIVELTAFLGQPDLIHVNDRVMPRNINRSKHLQMSQTKASIRLHRLPDFDLRWRYREDKISSGNKSSLLDLRAKLSTRANFTRNRNSAKPKESV